MGSRQKSIMEIQILSWTDILHILRNEKAAEFIEQCGDIPDYAPFYIARGTLFLNIQSEYCHPCNDFSAAVKKGSGRMENMALSHKLSPVKQSLRQRA